ADAPAGARSMKPRMSLLVTRPAKPVPGIVEMSTWCSAAILRTSGVDLRRRRSSAVSVPSPFATGADTGADGGGLGRTEADGGGLGRTGADRGGAAFWAAGAAVDAADAGVTAAPLSVSRTATSV